MEQFTLVALPHHESCALERDEEFVKRLFRDINRRIIPHIPQVAYSAYYAQIGPQFHKNESLFVFINEGNIVPLTAEEQQHLDESLRQFRNNRS